MILSSPCVSTLAHKGSVSPSACCLSWDNILSAAPELASTRYIVQREARSLPANLCLCILSPNWVTGHCWTNAVIVWMPFSVSDLSVVGHEIELPHSLRLIRALLIWGVHLSLSLHEVREATQMKIWISFRKQKGGEILDTTSKGIQHRPLGFFCGRGVLGACLEVLAYILDRTMVLLFQGRLSSSTECSASEAHLWSDDGGRDTCLTSQISHISAGDRCYLHMCCSDLEGVGSIFKRKQNPLWLIFHQLLFATGLTQEYSKHPRIRRPKYWLFQIHFGSSNSPLCFSSYGFGNTEPLVGCYVFL